MEATPTPTGWTWETTSLTTGPGEGKPPAKVHTRLPGVG